MGWAKLGPIGEVSDVLSRVLVPSMLVAALATAAPGQDQNSPFGGFKHDSKAPIEITANALEVRQADQIAVFEGDVVAGQGTLRLTAERVEVSYSQNGNDAQGTGAIRRMVAEGDVFLSNGAETARGARAEYDVEKGMVRMSGSVVLTQGQNAISGQSLVINLNSGFGRIEGSGTGRVKSIFTPTTDQGN